MYVGDRVRVVKLERHSPEDRSAYLERTGTLVQRLNVPWTPDLGSLWRARFPTGEEEVFAESEMALMDPGGTFVEPDMSDLKESWGQAPRTVSLPFRRRFGAGTIGARVLLAVLVFSISGVLLIWAGLAQSDVRLAVAGGALIALGLGAAAVMVS